MVMERRTGLDIANMPAAVEAVSLLVTQRDAEIVELKQRVEALRTDARAAVDYVMATNLQLCRLELSVRQTANLAWGAEFRLNKALALDTAKEN